MRSFALIAGLIAMLCSGCARLARIIPPSEEKTPLERALDENAWLNESLATETQVNRHLAYELEKTRIELEQARAALQVKAGKTVEVVPAFRDYLVENIKFGMLTGPSDWDGQPGLDGFSVSLLVEDSEGTTLKRKGNALFELIDIAGRKQEVIMTWALPAESFGAID